MFNNPDIDLRALPAFEEARTNALERVYPKVVLGSTLAFWLPIGIALSIAPFLADDTPGFARAAVVSVATVFVILLAWFRHKAASVISYAVREHDVVVRRGVFWVRETVQPINRVQHVERVQGPLEKRFKLARLRLFSAGTGNVTFEIPGLNEDQALQLQQFILERKKAAGHPSPAPLE